MVTNPNSRIDMEAREGALQSGLGVLNYSSICVLQSPGAPKNFPA